MSSQWYFETFRLDPTTARLWRGAMPVPLSPKAFDVLHYLVTHPGHLVTKDELLEALWPDTAVSDAVVRVTIGALRKALGDVPPRAIITVSRRGYRFLLPVTVVDSPSAAGTPLQSPVPTPSWQEEWPSPPDTGARQHGPGLAHASRTDTAHTRPFQRPASCVLLAGERKQATVLCAAIHDSPALLRAFDPEDIQQLLEPALHAMRDAVQRYGGTVHQVQGDGIVALFGVPVAYEDHTLRACYAALAMQAALRAYAADVRCSHGLALQSRMGLHAGEVVVRSMHHDRHAESSLFGPTTYVAARLEQEAPPGTMLLTAATARLVEGLIWVKALDSLPIKDLAASAEVCELLGASGLRGRLQRARARGLTPFVGRQMELATLRAALDQAGAGRGQIVAVVGEAGVGKSRLVDEFVRTAHAQGWLVLDCAAVSYGQATPYFPVLDLLRRYCQLEEREDTRTIEAKVTAQVLRLDAALRDTIPALLALLDALPADSPFLQLDAPQRRQHTLLALKRVLLREGQEQPVLLVVEDLHWLDTETQALLESLIESLPTVRLLLLVNYRLDYRHTWGSKTYYTQLRLDPLAPASTEAFLQGLLGGDPSLAPLTPLLRQHTEGNPFFLEESVRTLVETEVLVGQPGAYRLEQSLLTLPLPATVQAVLAARLDRLAPEVKQVLQTAAVLGMDIPVPVLQAVAEVAEEALQGALASLQGTEFLYETQFYPERAYTFKHALTQEVAYGSLLRERRRLLHVRILEALERLVADRLPEQVERLAYHALQGAVWEKALIYCQRAGDKALESSAPQEAAVYFEQALEALQHLPESHERHTQAIDLRLDLRIALAQLGDWGRLRNVLREADTLATALNDQRRLVQIMSALANHLRSAGDYTSALAAGQRARALAAALDDAKLQVMANAYLGPIYYCLGHFQQAREVLRANLDTLIGPRHYARCGLPYVAAVWSRLWLVMSLTEMGAFVEARPLSVEAVQIAEAVKHPYSLAVACYGVGFLSLYQGTLSEAIGMFERGLDVCHTGSIGGNWLIFFTASLGYAYALAGRLAEALPRLEQAVTQDTTLRSGRPISTWVTYLGLAHLLAGHLPEAQALVQQALASARQEKNPVSEAAALRCLGEIAARAQPPEALQAEAHYQQALTLAEALGMRPLQAHCHYGLGTLYAHTGQPAQAGVALTRARALYQAMHLSFWLPQTEAMRAQVHA